MAEEWRFFGCTLRDIDSQLGARCRATLTSGKEYTGYLYTVDPETQTALILLRQSQEPDQKQSQEHHFQNQGQDQPQKQQSLDGEQQIQAPSEDQKHMLCPTGLDERVLWTIVAVRQHALKSWMCPDGNTSDRLSLEEMDTITHISSGLSSPTVIQARKEALVEMLRSVGGLKRIPLETTADDPVVHIMTSAHVHPPYLAQSVECPNEVVRERVRAMVQGLQQG
ncbi:hypothetical protein BC939DRAFT_161912 [Gamsiella multidivaricata]|uniref:uncharacterized protein n=1 Tax=Gamsiella multidivaricata TaxID=101098 RepID=UPI00221F85C3|nr:uncharacterized protein BC939DRAFT_161912 [Gamsiella multidivaricata]KAI7823630.1 hypothetical protein BC939DRAFT_161912 [Gamsiella multidivaricata]